MRKALEGTRSIKRCPLAGSTLEGYKNLADNAMTSSPSRPEEAGLDVVIKARTLHLPQKAGAQELDKQTQATSNA